MSNRRLIPAYMLTLAAFLLLSAPQGAPAREYGETSVLWISSEAFNGDLDELVEKRIVRVLVPYTLGWFYFDGGRARGIEAELIHLLEEKLNESFKPGSRQITVVALPTARDNLLPYLEQGKGDIAAGNLTITPARQERVDFTIPWATNVEEVLVTGPSAPELSGIDDLAGQDINVRESSSYYQSLVALNRDFEQRGLEPLVIEPLSDILQDADLIEMVGAGLLPYAVVDLHKARFWAGIYEGVTVREDIVFQKDQSIAWAVRKDAPKLREFVDEFVKDHKKGTLIGNILIKRYLRDAGWLDGALDAGSEKDLVKLSDFFRRYGDEYGFDWLMIAAQAYQESKFDQALVSSAGAVGVMQLLPSTAADKNIGIPDIHDIDNNIHAGVKYMRFLQDRYFDEPGISDMNRVYFSWAAYNAGPGNVRKFRRLAKQRGLDPDVWFGQTELVAAEVIGRETVQYVRNIYKYFIAYTLTRRYKQAKEQHKITAG